jgi:LemA protein
MQLSQSVINKLIWVGGIVVALMVVFGMIASLSNTYVVKNNNVATSYSNISKEEQRRVDLFNNLVDAVQSATMFEKETQTKIAQARSQGNSGKIDQAMVTIQAVAEAYPQIKSVDLYKQTMTEFSITENRLAGYREQYNNDVRDYNNFVQSFWPSIFLPMVGKDTAPKKPLDYKVDNSQARDLFKK